MADIHKLIAAISPDIYCDPSVRNEVKKLVKEKGYSAAAEKAKRVGVEYLEVDDAKGNPFKKEGYEAPIQVNKLVYDSASESLEPIYFWLLDFMKNIYKKTDKLTDNFVAAPGSAYFSELGQKATRMQEEAMKVLGNVNTVLKSVLNLLYDLKEFRLRLDTYKEYHSDDKSTRNAALLSLKQIWLDSVDFKRGNSSIKGMAQQFDFVTLIDAFMSVRKPEDADNIDLNERVKRIVQQRIREFFKWVEESEKELTKRFEIEKRYLKSQVSALQLYSRWVKPYLKAARQLEQKADPEADLVTTFNSLILELTLLGQSPYDPEDDVMKGDLPKLFRNLKKRKYISILVLEFRFRGIPQRVGQGFSFGGKTDVTFTAYGLNEQEVKILKQEVEKDDIGEVMKLIEGATSESLEQIKKDIDDFLEDKDEKKEQKKKNDDDINPFSALFSFFQVEKKDKKKDEDLSKGIKPDDQYEKVLRSQAIINARDKATTVFDTYKKSHGMPAYP